MKKQNTKFRKNLFFLLLITTVFMFAACSNETVNLSSSSRVDTDVSGNSGEFTYFKLGDLFKPDSAYGEYYTHDSEQPTIVTAEEDVSNGRYGQRTDMGEVTYTVYNGYVQAISFFPKELWYREIAGGEQPVDFYNQWIEQYESKKVTAEELNELAMTVEEYVETKFHEQKEWFIPTDAELIREGAIQYASRPVGYEIYNSNSLPKGENTDIIYIDEQFAEDYNSDELNKLSPTEFVVEVPMPFPEFEPNHFSVHMDTRLYK